MSKLRFFILSALCLSMALFLCACSNGSGTGSEYSQPSSIKIATYSSTTSGSDSAGFDTSHVAEGYIAAKASNSSALKFQMTANGTTETFDMPNDGTPFFCSLSLGEGNYSFKIMQNTSGNRYVELASASASVSFDDEFAPFLVPNVYCNYTASSACVSQARQLTSSAKTQGEVVGAIYDWIKDNIRYDSAKAATLSNSSGYIPNPDSTLSSKTGVCFDYASLAAAMLRSMGIPCQIVTGYVSGNIYHAWNMVYIDGTWQEVDLELNGNDWERIDLTFAASGASSTIGDGTSYVDRYVY